MMDIANAFIYFHSPIDCRGTMERIYHATLLALYQLTLLAGIALMPLALLTERLGIRLPIHRAVQRLGDAYEQRTV